MSDYKRLKHLTGASNVAHWWRIHLPMHKMWVQFWFGKIPWRRKRHPTPVLFPGKSHRQRIWYIVHGVPKEWDMTLETKQQQGCSSSWGSSGSVQAALSSHWLMKRMKETKQRKRRCVFLSSCLRSFFEKCLVTERLLFTVSHWSSKCINISVNDKDH